MLSARDRMTAPSPWPFEIEKATFPVDLWQGGPDAGEAIRACALLAQSD
jgi:hypothetical protein